MRQIYSLVPGLRQELGEGWSAQYNSRHAFLNFALKPNDRAITFLFIRGYSFERIYITGIILRKYIGKGW